MMKPLFHLAIVALVSFLILTIAPALVSGAATEQQGNPGSATRDNSQIANPPGTKGPTLIGCLSGPDKDGKYTLHSMSHRTGVEVVGDGDELKNDSGAKVKLTGKWEAPQPGAAAQDKTNNPASDKKPAEIRRFQVTGVEVLAKTCSAPAEVTPESKNKRGKTTIYNAPSSDHSK